MKSQVVTPRAGRGGAAAGTSRAANGIVQRPASRRGGTRASSADGQGASRATLRRALTFAPLVAKVALAACIGVFVFLGYRAATSAAFFHASVIDVEGTARSSKEEIGRVVRRAVAPTGVWRADLDAISDELKRQPWVRTAVVSRVLPSGVRVRVTERTPRAVVRASAGRLMWVDDDAVTLGTAASTDALPPFFIRGWDESGSELARIENRARVAKYLELARDWETSGHSARISEVNLDDLLDVRVQLAGDDSQIEVRLGKQDLGKRLDKALQVLDEQRRTPRGPFITYVDLTQGTRAVIGSNPALRSARESASDTGDNDGDAVTTTTTTTNATAANAPRDVAKRKTNNRSGSTAEPGATRGAAAASVQEKRRAREVQASGRTSAMAERPRRATDR